MSSVRKDLKACIRHFTPSWHTVVMGTGSVSGLFSHFYIGQDTQAIKALTLLFFFLNLGFFVLICSATIARYALYPKVPMVRDAATPSAKSLHGRVSYGRGNTHKYCGRCAPEMAMGRYGIPVGLVGILVVGFRGVIRDGRWNALRNDGDHQHSLQAMSPLWLLPVVTLIVASSTGGIVAAAFPGHQSVVALTTAVSFTMLAMGLSVALMMITVYLMRCIIHGPLDTGIILSSFVVLGPLGQGGFSLLQNSANLSLIDLGPLITASSIQGACLCAAWVLFSMGIIWLCIAVMVIGNTLVQKRIPFSVGYWGMIFPNGVFALLAVQLGVVLDSKVMSYIGVVLSIGVFLLWVFVVTKTIPAIWNTTVFHSPCVAKYDEENAALESKPSTDAGLP
ncbi:unnamed protein product [Mycena citricolor]|uniref:Malic acid transport protein n=1 Tax=Mycena citricolor TaxID=2018698 RepID=A0AAD2JYS1_9AGAR|nr:unnamed protein product [Mycena citricolor]